MHRRARNTITLNAALRLATRIVQTGDTVLTTCLTPWN